MPASETVANGFVRPTTLAEALRLVADGGVPVAGATHLAAEVGVRGRGDGPLVSVVELPELRRFSYAAGTTDTTDTAGTAGTAGTIELGAALPLTTVERLLAGRVPLLTRLFAQFGSRPVRDAATLGGNLGADSPTGDSAPTLLALGASLVLASLSGTRVVALTDFFLDDRWPGLEPGELIRSVLVPAPAQQADVRVLTSFQKTFPLGPGASPLAAIALAIAVSGDEIVSARIGVGGAASTPVRAYATESALVGRAWTLETVTEVSEVMAGEGSPSGEDRTAAAYRQVALRNALLRCYEEQL